jgi:hypothetical protein
MPRCCGGCEGSKGTRGDYGRAIGYEREEGPPGNTERRFTREGGRIPWPAPRPDDRYGQAAPEGLAEILTVLQKQPSQALNEFSR